MLSKDELDLRDLKLDLRTVDVLFEKWYREEETLSGVLNMKLIKQRNQEFRSKIEAWKKRRDERKRHQRKAIDQAKKLNAQFEKMQDDFNIDRDRVVGCAIDYKNFIEEKDTIERDEKTINDFLALLPEGGVSHSILEVKDIERLQENDQRNFKVEFTMLREFASVVKTECVMKTQFFSFYDIPDLIIKKRYVRKDYD